MKVVVLTGGIASGKSTVSRILADMGVPVIDADLVAREVVEPGRDAHREIVEAFGRGVLREDGTIDRERLGRIVFTDKTLREKLERITHPRIGERMAQLLAVHAAAGAPAAVLDIPLYIENKVRHGVAGTSDDVGRGVSGVGPRPARDLRATDLRPDFVLVVTVDEATQAERLVGRDGLTREDAQARIAAQMPLSEKAKHADYVIDNSGTPDQTAARVREVWKRIAG